MHDTYLLNKISQSLNQICQEHNIKTISNFTLVVNNNSHINEENLLEYLVLHNKNIIAKNLKIKVQKDDIESQTAIISSLEGERFDM